MGRTAQHCARSANVKTMMDPLLRTGQQVSDRVGAWSNVRAVRCISAGRDPVCGELQCRLQGLPGCFAELLAQFEALAAYR